MKIEGEDSRGLLSEARAYSAENNSILSKIGSKYNDYIVLTDQILSPYSPFPFGNKVLRSYLMTIKKHSLFISALMDT